MRIMSLFLVALFMFSTAGFAAEPKHVYVCPMPAHSQEFDKPGNCPICGMELVESRKRLRIGVLIFDYVEDIDFTAPIEVLGKVESDIFTVASSKQPIRTVYGLQITPEYDLAHAPETDVLLVPGGGVAGPMSDGKVIAWLKERAPKARYVLSVCNGAFIIAKAGLLDGLTATTTAGRIDELAEAAPKTKVVRERIVDNGKVITAAGLSAGIDGALHVIEREHGRIRAEEAARRIEYRWDPESPWTRSTLADLRMPDVELPKGSTWQTLTSAGDSQQWEKSGRLTGTSLSEEELLDLAAKQITHRGWTLRESTKDSRSFEKKDRDGQTWVATLASRAESGALVETMRVKRVGS